MFDPTAAVELLEDTTSGSETDTPFATRVRGMPSDSFLSCLSMCFENLLQVRRFSILSFPLLSLIFSSPLLSPPRRLTD